MCSGKTTTTTLKHIKKGRTRNKEWRNWKEVFWCSRVQVFWKHNYNTATHKKRKNKEQGMEKLEGGILVFSCSSVQGKPQHQNTKTHLNNLLNPRTPEHKNTS